MNNSDLDQLLSKFYRGETTLDEEQQLRSALSDDSVDALLMKELESVDNAIEVPDDLESDLSNLIDQWQDEEKQATRVATVAPSMWRRSSWWAAAASVAIIATVGVWLLRNQQSPQPGKQQPVIAQVEEPETPPAAQELPPSETQPEQQPAVLPQAKPKVQQPKPARVFNNNVEHLAQAHIKPQPETQAQALPELSVSDEQLAMAALEKFSSTLNKGIDQLDDAGEKIDNINNTIKQFI